MRFAHKRTFHVHFPNNFSIIDINLQNIENRQYIVNMKAKGVVVMTEFATTFALPGFR